MGETPLWLSTMLLGMGTVFVGLICLIFITKLMSVVVRRMDIASEKKRAPAGDQTPIEAAGEATRPIPDRGTLVAAVSACIATVLGKDITGLRIVSIKRANG